MKKTKILCTIGPASIEKQTLQQMYNAGMNGARINTAYGDQAQYRKVIKNVREVAEIPIILDLKGPEIRLHASQPQTVNKGDFLEVGFDGEATSFNHDFYDKVSVDDYIYVDNGKIKTQIVEKANRKLRLIVLDKGRIEDGKGINVPNKQLSVPTLCAKDFELIAFAKELDVEYLALSFTRNANDIKTLQANTQNFTGGIIAKIENFEGVNNIEEIMDVADGVMVARGDLGVEIEPERVPLVQKRIIRRCNQRGMLVVTATEMLDSMIHQSNPTRAEVSDVANAILDGTDAVMLSGETAIGMYPVDAVGMMSRIAVESEKAVETTVVDTGEFLNISDTVSEAIQWICNDMPLDKVITLTRSGYTARMITRFKVPQPIIAVTPNNNVKKQLELIFGVQPVQIDYRNEKDRILSVATKLHDMNLVDEEDIVLFTAAMRTTKTHASNTIEIHSIKGLKKLASL
ncbi:MAG: pyruvate kinase [Candidatus Bathyarchaeota archaeon]|nr:pyruvate kinase [Candidatus Bathyarchaeota archaeon]